MPANQSASSSPLARRGFTLLELMVCVAIIAVLAVVAIPQFTHHMRMARTTEATLMLDVIKKGATAYYASPRTDASGARLPCQFPKSTPLTPQGGGSCCDGALDGDGDGRCDPDPHAFDTPTWESVNFGLAQAHLFLYKFEGKGTLKDATAMMSAFGDQDCDGLLSTFHLVLDGDPNATLSGCDSTSSPSLYYELETE